MSPGRKPRPAGFIVNLLSTTQWNEEEEGTDLLLNLVMMKPGNRRNRCFRQWHFVNRCTGRDSWAGSRKNDQTCLLNRRQSSWKSGRK